MTWSWIDGEIDYAARCTRCSLPLRQQTPCVRYKDCEFHLTCLLDYLTDGPGVTTSPFIEVTRCPNCAAQHTVDAANGMVCCPGCAHMRQGRFRLVDWS